MTLSDSKETYLYFDMTVGIGRIPRLPSDPLPTLVILPRSSTTSAAKIKLGIRRPSNASPSLPTANLGWVPYFKSFATVENAYSIIFLVP